jgi:pimeloyl-ACP methyl ester carboxylesterase
LTVNSISPSVIAGFDSQSTTVAGIRLHYWIGGDLAGQPVILWHGFLSTAYAWRDVAPALAKAGLAVLIPDMRGYGDSDKPAGEVPEVVLVEIHQPEQIDGRRPNGRRNRTSCAVHSAR